MDIGLLAALIFTWNMACILPAAYTRNIPRGTKVFAWAITEFQSSSRTANAIWQWAKVWLRRFFWRRRQRRFLRFWTI